MFYDTPGPHDHRLPLATVGWGLGQGRAKQQATSEAVVVVVLVLAFYSSYSMILLSILPVLWYYMPGEKENNE